MSLERFAVSGQPGIDGVLVLDCRASLGPTAFDDHSVLVAVAGLIADAIRSRRDLPRARARMHASQSVMATAPAPNPEPPPIEPQSGDTPRRSLKTMLMAVEREILIAALREADGNYSRAARALQTTPRILAYRLKRHGLHVGPRRPGP
jgi:transcriptional regulator with GAF, ATPase, and Fis domain